MEYLQIILPLLGLGFATFLVATARSKQKTLEHTGIKWLKRLLNDCASQTNINLPFIPEQFYKEITDINCKYIRAFLKNRSKQDQESAIINESIDTAKCMLHIFQCLNLGDDIRDITHEMYMHESPDGELIFNLDPKLIQLMGKFGLLRNIE